MKDSVQLSDWDRQRSPSTVSMEESNQYTLVGLKNTIGIPECSRPLGKSLVYIDPAKINH